MNHLPSGTVTFLFTDIEGSTRLWGEYPEEMKSALARHDAILRECVESNHGHIIKTTGDGIYAVFEKTIDGAKATVQAQRSLRSSASHPAPAPEIKVRIGLHTGEAELRDNDYHGQTLNRAARIMAAGWGGQILVSAVTAEILREQLPEGMSLQDLGEHRLKDLILPEHLYQLNTPELRQDFPALRSLNTLPNNLPLQLTSFIGREKEVSEIKGLLQSARLVTLTGSGGTGKTRLAQEAGAEVLTAFPHGVWLIELAALTDPAQITPAAAQVFGLQALPLQPLEALVTDYLRDKKALLILDNCEHLIEACARLANDLLHQCAGLKILASSREALGIAGEAAYPTPSLGEAESTRLFVERAQAVNPNFKLTDPDAASIAQICARLDGIPLAIELAAARTKLLSLDQIAKRLDDRFHLLVGGSRTTLPRQQTLRALIDWSYDLLSEEEKRLLRTASVFTGGWTLEALEAVAAEANTLEQLELLINKSLVLPVPHGNEMRYGMLETIRQYAREKLFDAKESTAVRDRHLAYFDEVSEALWDGFRSGDTLNWRDRTDDEAENLRAALDWALGQHTETALHLAANLCILSSWAGGLVEGMTSLKSAIARFRALPASGGQEDVQRQRSLAKALFAQGMIAMGTGEMVLSRESLEEAISLARRSDDRRILGYSLEMYYVACAFFQDELVEARAAEEGYAIFCEINDDWGMGLAMMNMERLAALRGDREEGQKFSRILREIMRDSPLSFQTGMGYLRMGYEDRYRQGDLVLAKQHFEEGLRVFRLLRHRVFENSLQSEIGHIARVTGDLQEAKRIYRHTMATYQDLGHRAAIAHQLECFAFMAISEEEPERAAKLLGAAEALRERVNSQMTEQERIEYDQFLVTLRSMLVKPDLDALWNEGRSMTMKQAIEFALA